MDLNFWIDRWERGQIGFHRPEANALLRRHWPALALPPGTRVLVPLCGKSLDMRWLAAQGHPVLGVEGSEIAVRAFFAEAGVEPARRRVGRFEVWGAAGVEIACGDFFDLPGLPLDDVGAFYDRAALVAVSPEERARYAGLLCALPRGARGLVITMAYDQEVMPGPPFSVEDADVEALFGARFDLRRLSRDDILPESPRWLERGAKRLDESAFLLTDRT